MNEELVMLVKFIADKVEHLDIIAENTPQSSAAGIIYFVSYMAKLSITKHDVKKLCDVSEVTINKCYNKFYKARYSILPNCIMIANCDQQLFLDLHDKEWKVTSDQISIKMRYIISSPGEVPS